MVKGYQQKRSPKGTDQMKTFREYANTIEITSAFLERYAAEPEGETFLIVQDYLEANVPNMPSLTCKPDTVEMMVERLEIRCDSLLEGKSA